MKNRLFAIGAMILMMTSCTQDELISSDKGKEPATAGSCLTLVGLSSPQTRVSIGDKTGDVYPVLWSEGDALGVFSRTAGTDINNVQSLLSDESIGQNSGVFTSDDVKMAEVALCLPTRRAPIHSAMDSIVYDIVLFLFENLSTGIFR